MKQNSLVWARVIRPAMTRQGIKTQKMLADWSGVSLRTISYIKNGNVTSITTGTLSKLSSALSVNVTELMLFF